jgi:RNA polymerase sigma factor (sigma-70 family)
MSVQRGPGASTCGRRSISACEGLGEEESGALRQLFAQRHDFIHHARLDEEGIEEELFGPDFDERFVENRKPDKQMPTPDRFRKLTPKQETRTFLRYNCARRAIVRLLAGQQENAPMSRETAGDLLRWYRRVLAVRAEIVNANFPLVLAMARNTRFTSLDMNELISEGNMAMLRSINRFDLTKGYRFSSYACRSILKAFSRVAMRTSRYREHFQTENEVPLEGNDFKESRQQEIRQNFLDELERILSMNAAHLSDIERMVIAERFALQSGPASEAGEPKTLGEVGEMVGLTKERVRQIQNRALEKLRIAMMNRIAAA